MHAFARIEAIFHGKLILPFSTLIPDSGANAAAAPRIRQKEQLQRGGMKAIAKLNGKRRCHNGQAADNFSDVCTVTRGGIVIPASSIEIAFRFA